MDRVFPLSGILKHPDQSPYWGAADYYQNETHRLRFSVQLMEDQAKKIIKQVLSNSPELRLAVKKFGSEAKTKAELLEYQKENLVVAIEQLDRDKQALNTRVNFFISNLKDGDEDQASRESAEMFRNEFKAELTTHRDSLALLDQRKRDFEADAFNWKELADKAVEIQKYIQEKDPVALKNAYRKLFDSIIVSDEDEKGVRQLTFVFVGGLGSTLESPAMIAAENSRVDEYLG